jgi:hypothetical protein
MVVISSCGRGGVICGVVLPVVDSCVLDDDIFHLECREQCW